MLYVKPEILKKELITNGMLASLEEAYMMQMRGKSFSLKDLSGSKAGLINRDLLEFATKYTGRQLVCYWRVTKKGLVLFRFLKKQKVQ